MFPVRQVLSAIDRAKNQGIGPADFVAERLLRRRRRQGVPPYEERLAAANATDFGGLLLSALSCARAARPPPRRSARASTTCWSTSSRTPTACSTGWCGCCRGAPAASPSSATTTSPSTAGAAPTSATSSTSSATTRARAWSSWSRTTARPATSCAPPTRSSRSNSERRPKRLFTEEGDGEPIVLFEGETERDEAEFVASRIETRCPRRWRRATSPSSTAPTPSRACSKRRCARATCPTRSSAARASSIAPRSRTSPATCARSPTPTTAWRCSGSSTSRRAASAAPPSIASARSSSSASCPAWQALELVARDDQELLGTGPRKKVAAFVQLMTRLRAEGSGLGPASLAEKVLEETGYRDALAGEATMEAEGRAGEPAGAGGADARIREGGRGPDAARLPGAHRAGLRRRRLRPRKGRRSR